MQNIALILNDSLEQIGNKKFKSDDEFFTWKNATLNIRLDSFLYKNDKYTYYAYIYPTDERLLISKVNEKLEPITKDSKTDKITERRIVKIKEKIEKGDLKLIVGENIIGQLARIALRGVNEFPLLFIIIIAVVGISCGIGGYGFGASHIHTIILNQTIPNSTPIPSI